ncbi:histidine kinase [Paenibacillus sp. BSR1-1]|uniref:sensor histidine kinase n=1 Tax=Paenibacillus sp. BSR1-1 TaxID=3020845 RepID=UPI0025B04D86|nr:sensor histidine kinase [Paenibacillus sp. BSR1-1]MDN3018455.1 histidine kinase [Paenibacillus sp. BSR1-1]
MRKLSYYQKVQASFIILILLPLMVISMLSYKSTKDMVKEKISLSNRSVLNLLSKDISKTVDDLNYVTHFYVENDDTIQTLNDVKDTAQIKSYRDYEDYQRVIASFDFISIKMLSTEIHMFLVNNKGFIIPYSDSMSGKTTSINVLNRHWKLLQPQIDRNQTTHLQSLGIVSDPKDGNSYYYFSRVIKHPKTGEPLAVLNIGISKKYFETLFESARTGKLALYDENGKIIAGDSKVAFEGENKVNGEIRDEVIIPISKWKLIHKTTKEEITGQISKTFFVSAIIVIVFFFIFLFISFLIAKRLHRPIQRLSFVATKFGKGERDVRFLPAGRDEINELGRTINNMLDEINNLIEKIEREQEEKREIELRALFAQIRPHFLLNTLNSIKCSLFINNDYEHADKISALMSLLRAYMKIDESSTIESECKLLTYYIEIMRMRTEVNVDLIVEMEDQVKNIKLPKLLLQPFIENAIVHGFSERSAGEIVIRVNKIDQWGFITISDNGKGMSENQILEINRMLKCDSEAASYNRVGLKNIAKRLKLYYGSNGDINFQRNDNGGIKIVIQIPFDTDKEGEK